MVLKRYKGYTEKEYVYKANLYKMDKNYIKCYINYYTYNTLATIKTTHNSALLTMWRGSTFLNEKEFNV